MSDFPSLTEIEEQERKLVFSAFSNQDAIDIGMKLIEIGRERKLPITIDIIRGGQQIFHAALPGTSADNDVWVKRKSSVVMRFARSSLYMGRSCAEGNATLQSRYGLDPVSFSGSGGGFPITIASTGVIGAITVSGLPQQDDHALAVEVINWFLNDRGK